MNRKLASIQLIKDLRPIPNADAIVCAQVLGWECVTKKNEFNANDKCVYFEIDSVLPIAHWNDHLRKEADKKLRVKTIRLRGQLSQGLALPLSILPLGEYEVGDDVTDIIGVEKYEPVVPMHLTGMVKGNFPSFLHKTDEVRLQSVPEVLNEIVSKNIPMVATLKMDGTSFTAYRRDTDFGVCSRNLDLKESENNIHWKMARKLKIEDILRSEPRNLCIQGEICGPGIQANRLALKEAELYLFNLFDIDTGKYLGFDELKHFAMKHNLHTVPFLYLGWFNDIDGTKRWSVNDLLEFSNKLNYDNGTPAEGVVWRAVNETHSEVLKGRMSWKCISNRFLEKYKE